MKDTRGKTYEIGQRVAHAKCLGSEVSISIQRVSQVMPTLRFGKGRDIRRPDRHLILEDLPE